MKKIIFTVTLSIIIVNSFSQGFFKESKKGINVSTELWNYGICLFSNFTLDYKKSTFGIGPSINIYPSYNFAEKVDNVYYPTKNKFFGFHLYYQYNFRPNKIFDFFVQTNLSYEYLELLNYEEPSTKLESDYEYKTINISQTFGPGFKINITKKFYTNLCVDIGFNYYQKISRTIGNTIQTDEQMKGSGLIRIGMGYRF